MKTAPGLYFTGAMDPPPMFGFCTIDLNEASGDGGGMFCNGGSPFLAFTHFTGNSAVYAGGSFYCYSGTPKIVCCTFDSNSAGTGSGIFGDTSNMLILNSLFTNNHAIEFGGGPVRHQLHFRCHQLHLCR